MLSGDEWLPLARKLDWEYSYVREDAATTNFGTNITVNVRPDATKRRTRMRELRGADATIPRRK